jgi:DNA polymerase-4
VAKLAVEVAKPRGGRGGTGVHVVAPGDEQEFMRRFDLGDIPGIGPRFRSRLEAAGLRTVRDVLAMPEAALARSVGPGDAAWLLRKARGLDDHVVERRERSKSLSREETFDRDIADDATLEQELLALCARVAADLRDDDLATRTISVKLRDRDFRTRRASRTLRSPVVADRIIHQTARELLRKLRRARRIPARLLGVALTSLSGAVETAQLPLLPESASGAETERDRTLSRAVDTVRARFGREAIVAASLADRGRRR